MRKYKVIGELLLVLLYFLRGEELCTELKKKEKLVGLQ